MSRIEVDKIQQQCGTTLTVGGGAGKTAVVDATTVTLGRCGGTVSLASGATQSGFGRTGTVDWQTGDIKTATFTAANGEGYFANTSGGAFTMNLPAGTAGNIVSVVDYTNTFQTNALTISPNGSQKLGGTNASFTASTEGQSLTFVYVDDTEGWKNVQDSTSNATGNPFLIATGGTVTCCGNCKIHTFTGPGTFTVCKVSATAAENIVSYLVVAGGGGSGHNNYAGGGGAGGFRELKSPSTPYTASPLDGYPSAPNRVTVTATSFPITVGSGGTGAGNGGKGAVGSVSTFSTITSAGGGGGGAYTGGGGNCATDGGSGGGGSANAGAAGSGNTPSTTPAQGTNGGAGSGSSGGGGGGATTAGSTGGPSGAGSAGGTGGTTNIPGSPITKSSGGDGAGSSTPATNGGANTGDGGCRSNPGTFPNGGSGIVVIRYKFQ